MSDIICIIVEDEPLAVKVLVDYISQVPFLQLQETFKDAILATDWLRHNNTELIKTLAAFPFLNSLDHLLNIWTNSVQVLDDKSVHIHAFFGDKSVHGLKLFKKSCFW